MSRGTSAEGIVDRIWRIEFVAVAAERLRADSPIASSYPTAACGFFRTAGVLLPRRPTIQTIWFMSHLLAQ
jgi:hypothetical protein